MSHPARHVDETPTAPTSEPLTPETFGDRYRRSYQVLWLVAAGIVRNRTQADDIVQEAAMIACRKLDQFDPASSFNAWMGQIVRFVAFNHVRKGRRRNTSPSDPHTLDAATAAPESAGLPQEGLHRSPLSAGGSLRTDQQDFDDRTVAALNALGETARACLLLRVVGQLEYREIARIMDVPEGTAMSHVHRSRQQLRERLGSPEGSAKGGQP